MYLNNILEIKIESIFFLLKSFRFSFFLLELVKAAIDVDNRALLSKIKWKIEKKGFDRSRVVCINFYTNVYPYQLSCKMNRVNVI